MSLTKRACSPSVAIEVTDPNTADSKVFEEDQPTQSEAEFMSGHDKPKMIEKCSRNVPLRTLCTRSSFQFHQKVSVFGRMAQKRKLGTVDSECIVFKTAQTNTIGPVIYRITHLSPLRGFKRIENKVSAHAHAQRKWRAML